MTPPFTDEMLREHLRQTLGWLKAWGLRDDDALRIAHEHADTAEPVTPQAGIVGAEPDRDDSDTVAPCKRSGEPVGSPADVYDATDHTVCGPNGSLNAARTAQADRPSQKTRVDHVGACLRASRPGGPLIPVVG